ncbi:hypothetical protein MM300_01855 [Evansella sp. LMS18]|jgi:hypothetical protein|uniref:hypothetical protein n=1 Tax=Evansella sp. LMS18 TaxID=2924033 RepID=UPI0020D0A0FE|nr:hypothetical protein [Evansella sp. LMS18]UTR11101.1 hypothetical protein MM300_01855 [Evansella sp. LMS18]
MVMGYIPPVRDEQMIIYGSRQQKHSPSVSPAAAVQRAEFYEFLRNRSRCGNFFERNVVKQQLKRKVKECENTVTGKGSHIDISI